jgi:hypothetical protein
MCTCELDPCGKLGCSRKLKFRAIFVEAISSVGLGKAIAFPVNLVCQCESNTVADDGSDRFCLGLAMRSYCGFFLTKAICFIALWFVVMRAIV